MFSKITAATEFQGSSKVISVKLQLLRRELETFQMKENEAIQEFISRVMNVVNQMRTNRDPIEDQTIVAKILRSLYQGSTMPLQRKEDGQCTNLT